MNMFSTAMASGKDKDDRDDKRYHYDDKNRYQQSTYGNDRYASGYDMYYGYDNSYDDKQQYDTSYDINSYNVDNAYSKYPTKDKKYECQKGQFEGFFVSSVEFCKLKIREGPAGPQGPQGPQGPAGQINFTNTYRVVGPGATITSETPSRAFSVSLCDTGDIVLEGGGSVANFLDEGLGNVFQITRETVTVNEQNGYRVGGVGANLTSFDSNVICIDNPPLRP